MYYVMVFVHRGAVNDCDVWKDDGGFFGAFAVACVHCFQFAGVDILGYWFFRVRGVCKMLQAVDSWCPYIYSPFCVKSKHLLII